MAEEAAWVEEAALALSAATTVMVTAGAGMGCDSGLPDFRGPEGFWRAYPPMQARGLAFSDVSNPKSFEGRPEFGWGFFGHRYALYDAAVPHEGYHVARRWQQAAPKPGFVFTSNVDGQFERADFPADRIVECHGSIHFHQCSRGRCGAGIWPAAEGMAQMTVNAETFVAEGTLPSCRCGELARPGILMFGDWGWDSSRTDEQERRWVQWQGELDANERLVVVEVGAGLAVPTVRLTSERMLEQFPEAVLIRINPREPDGPEELADRIISVPANGMDAIVRIDEALGRLRGE